MPLTRVFFCFALLLISLDAQVHDQSERRPGEVPSWFPHSSRSNNDQYRTCLTDKWHAWNTKLILKYGDSGSRLHLDMTYNDTYDGIHWLPITECPRDATSGEVRLCGCAKQGAIIARLVKDHMPDGGDTVLLIGNSLQEFCGICDAKHQLEHEHGILTKFVGGERYVVMHGCCGMYTQNVKGYSCYSADECKGQKCNFHGGYSGFTTTQILGELLSLSPPAFQCADVILVHMGTNDVLKHCLNVDSEGSYMDQMNNLEAIRLFWTTTCPTARIVLMPLAKSWVVGFPNDFERLAPLPQQATSPPPPPPRPRYPTVYDPPPVPPSSMASPSMPPPLPSGLTAVDIRRCIEVDCYVWSAGSRICARMGVRVRREAEDALYSGCMFRLVKLEGRSDRYVFRSVFFRYVSIEKGERVMTTKSSDEYYESEEEFTFALEKTAGAQKYSMSDDAGRPVNVVDEAQVVAVDTVQFEECRQCELSNFVDRPIVVELPEERKYLCGHDEQFLHVSDDAYSDCVFKLELKYKFFKLRHGMSGKLVHVNYMSDYQELNVYWNIPDTDFGVQLGVMCLSTPVIHNGALRVDIRFYSKVTGREFRPNDEMYVAVADSHSGSNIRLLFQASSPDPPPPRLQSSPPPPPPLPPSPTRSPPPVTSADTLFQEIRAHVLSIEAEMDEIRSILNRCSSIDRNTYSCA